MSTQLDILALEPFYGGVRRAMLETLVRCSRHRWTVLKLPPRRIERRLTAAANWFSEQLSRHWVGRLDLLFTSEAMNLASLLRLVPELTRHPAVVYFHDNQMPDAHSEGQQPHDLVNLNTATAATELWFNSLYHRSTFQALAAAMVDRHPELSSRSPIPELKAKSRLMPPPVDLGLVHEIEASGPIQRNPRTIFVETRDADIDLLNSALALLRTHGVAFNVVTVGPVDELDSAIPRRTIPEKDEAGQARAMFEAGVVVSVKPMAASDYLVVRAIAAGCRPVLPDSGMYPEIIPAEMQRSCLYEISPDGLAEHIIGAMRPNGVAVRSESMTRMLRPFDAIAACRAIDERVEQLVHANTPHPGVGHG